MYEIFAGYVMADGKIVNDDAMVIGKVSGGREVSAARAKK